MLIVLAGAVSAALVLPSTNVAPRAAPKMSFAWDAIVSPENKDALDLYMATTFAGLCTTAVVAPLMYAKPLVEAVPDTCELVEMPDSDYNYICSGEPGGANCQQILHDGELVWACAY